MGRVLLLTRLARRNNARFPVTGKDPFKKDVVTTFCVLKGQRWGLSALNSTQKGLRGLRGGVVEGSIKTTEAGS